MRTSSWQVIRYEFGLITAGNLYSLHAALETSELLNAGLDFDQNVFTLWISFVDETSGNLERGEGTKPSFTRLIESTIFDAQVTHEGMRITNACPSRNPVSQSYRPIAPPKIVQEDRSASP
ncbi:hypothetical protein [Bradyrhizobium sp. ORS 86]|uniref:hypothetical protein n=1 Tax=Bradyrhizobium sp. ORS 86 TaxID=1685970 RepID=UPI00388FAB47